MAGKDLIKKQGVRDRTGDLAVGGGVYDALDEKVKDLLDEAVQRAEDNGRRTLKARDL